MQTPKKKWKKKKTNTTPSRTEGCTVRNKERHGWIIHTMTASVSRLWCDTFHTSFSFTRSSDLKHIMLKTATLSCLLPLAPFFQSSDQGSEIFMRLSGWQRRWRGARLVTHNWQTVFIASCFLFCWCETCQTRCERRNENNLTGLKSRWDALMQRSTHVFWNCH